MLPRPPPVPPPAHLFAAELRSAPPELHALGLLDWVLPKSSHSPASVAPSPTSVAPDSPPAEPPEAPGTPPAEPPEATGHRAPPPRTPPRPPAEPTEAPGSPPARPPRWWGPPAGPRNPAKRNRERGRRVRLHNLELRMTMMQQKIDEVWLEQKQIRLQLAKLHQQIQPPTRPIGARRRPAVSEPKARARPSQAIGMETEWDAARRWHVGGSTSAAEGNRYYSRAAPHLLRGAHSGQRG